MKNSDQLKKELLQLCHEHIKGRIQTIRARILSIEEARNNETKSSAGDKHEIGRAMMQLEEEKSQAQLMEANKVMQALAKIDLEANRTALGPGSLVITNKGTYFISIGIGKVKWKGDLYFCISINAPIALALKNKRPDDDILFNGRKIRILELI